MVMRPRWSAVHLSSEVVKVEILGMGLLIELVSTRHKVSVGSCS